MNTDNTQEKILDAARKVFVTKGMDGARMQEIADEAGINKALLHYYFRTKQQLFDAIFEESMGKLVPNMMEIFKQKSNFREKIEAIVEAYDSVIRKNPFLPQFVIREINRDPDQLAGAIRSRGFDSNTLNGFLDEDIKNGVIAPITMPHLFANLVGMMMIPYAGRPLLQQNLFNNNAEEYDKFLLERRQVVTQFILHALQYRGDNPSGWRQNVVHIF